MVGCLGGLPPVVILTVFFPLRGGGDGDDGDGDDGDGGDGDSDSVKGAGHLGGFAPVFILIILLTGIGCMGGAPVSPVDATSTASSSFGIFFAWLGVESSSTTTGP